MRVLAIDTVSPFPTVALLDTESAGPRESAEPLPPAAAEALAASLGALLGRAGLAPAGLDRVAVLSGPGSFTGLKAGAAFARGLARAAGAPLVSFSTFRAASEARPEPAGLDFVCDAGRGEVHRARRRPDGLTESPAPVRRADAERDAAADGVPLCDLGETALGLATVLARLAASVHAPDAAPFRPAYGRPSAAEERMSAGRGETPAR